jgi:hypothetical protein
MKRAKKLGPTRQEIRDVVQVTENAFNNGALTGILFFDGGLRTQITAAGSIVVDWRANLSTPYKGVYSAPVNYTYQPYVTPKNEMYPEPDA